MIIYKAHKFRIYPTEQQKILLSKHFGACRFIYNYFLNERKEKYLSEKTSLNYYDNSKKLTEIKNNNYEWLMEINGQSLQSALRNLDTAYKKFYNKDSKFPKFKSKNNKQSFTVPQRTKLKNSLVCVPKFTEGIKINLHREIEGKIKHSVISKTTAGNFYISIICEIEFKSKSNIIDSSVGIDTGLKDLAILSDGTKYNNPKFLKKQKKKLQYQQRQLNKKKKGSNSRKKQKQILALTHEKITNTRKDHLHKITTEIIKNHGIICVETLSVKNMMKNHSLAGSFNDAAIGLFYSMLQYKADWDNKKFIKIDRFFPSTKTCSNCGHINQNLTLAIREWECPQCYTNHDRDINAAKNILKQGLNLLSGSGMESDIKQKQVEALPLGESTKPEILYG